MSPIAADHFAREAIVYVRQPTADQVITLRTTGGNKGQQGSHKRPPSTTNSPQKDHKS